MRPTCIQLSTYCLETILYEEEHPMREHALEVYQGETLIFYSDGKWLHPLLDLEQFLAAHPYDPGALSVHDKIVGRAAAFP